MIGAEMMGKRRRNGEGSICKRKDGRYQCQAIVGISDDGKVKRKTLYGKNESEVIDKLNQLLIQVKQNSYIEPTKMTLSEWLNKWMTNYKKLTLKRTTWELYNILIEKHIKPEIGGIKLSKLQTGHIQGLYSKKSQEGSRADNRPGSLSPKSIRHIHTVIRSALEQALRERLISINPADAAVLPRNYRKEMKILDIQGITKFLSAAKGSRYYTAFLLILATGLRRGEALGLRWKDIDLQKGVINVKQQLVRVKGGFMFSDLKTELSRRMVAIDDDIVQELKEHMESQMLERQKNHQIYEKNDLVFCSEIGKPIPPRNFVRYFKAILKKAGLDEIRLHDLRHTYATMVLGQGISHKTLQENLGHYSASFTIEMYGHNTQDMKRDAAEKVGSLLKKCVDKEITPDERG